MGVKLDREGFENRTRSRRAFDAIRVKVRDEGTVRNKAVYVALGVRPEGANEISGLWIEQTEEQNRRPARDDELLYRVRETDRHSAGRGYYLEEGSPRAAR